MKNFVGKEGGKSLLYILSRMKRDRNNEWLHVTRVGIPEFYMIALFFCFFSPSLLRSVSALTSSFFLDHWFSSPIIIINLLREHHPEAHLHRSPLLVLAHRPCFFFGLAFILFFFFVLKA